MKIYSIISKIEQILEESPKAKMAGQNKRVVDVDQLLDLLGDLKVTIPEDIRKAGGILAESRNIITDANEQADEMLEKAQKEAEGMMQQAQDAAQKVYDQSVQQYEFLVSDSNVMREANQQAQQISDAAVEHANALSLGARQYADDVLSDVQRYLNEYMRRINENRSELELPPEAKPLKKLAPKPGNLPPRPQMTQPVPAVETEPEYEDEPIMAPQSVRRPEPELVRAPVARQPELIEDHDADEEYSEHEDAAKKKKGWFKRMLEGDDEEFDDDDNWQDEDQPEQEEKPKKKKRSKLFEFVSVDDDDDEEDS